MKTVAFILSVLLPGCGQVLLSRYRKGLVLFFSIVISLDLSVIIIPFLLPTLGVYPAQGGALRFTLYALCFIIYLYNIWDIFNIVYWRERNVLRQKKNIFFKQGIIYYLQNDLNNAKKEFIRGLTLDKDDIDIIYYLSKIEKSLGATSREKRLLNKLTQLDLANKWK